MGGFTGWKGDFQGFFVGLVADNSKANFERHRRLYERDVKGPMVELLAGLEPEFGPGRLSRPNRDIRFSADKSPYKTNIYASAQRGGYVALDATGLVAAGGRHMLDGQQLARFRGAVADERTGSEVAEIVAILRRKGYEIGGEALKRVPAPHAQDHPRAALLRHKRLVYWKRWEIGPWIGTPEPLERVRAVWRDGHDLTVWLTRSLDGC